jgi:hypothetical protein
MQFFSLTALALLATTHVFAQDFDDLDNDDIPSQCSLVCSNIVDVSNTCDRAFDNDRAELNCFCMAENAATVVPLCASCVSSVRNEQNDDDDDDDDDNNDTNGKTTIRSACFVSQNTHTPSVDVDELRRECGFSTTTYNPTSSYTQLLLVAATGNSVSQSTGTMTSASSIAASTSTASSSAAATNTEATSVVAGETGNGAAIATALPRMENLGAVAGVAALAVAAWV